MKLYIEKIEMFLKAHEDYPVGGYLMAKAGFNALGSGEFQKTCTMLEKSLKLRWGFTKQNEKQLERNKVGTESALHLLQEKGVCK